MSKVVLITGASRGLGRMVAESLVKAGYIVYSGVRKLALAPEGTYPLRLDLQDETTFQVAIDQIIAEQGRVDTVIHNAGLAYYGGADTLTLQEARDLFETNFFGPFRLTQLLIPVLQKQEESRILFVSSIRGIESHAFMGMYSGSKAAIESLAFDWSVTLAKWNIHVSVIQPGAMDTGIKILHGSFYEEEKNPHIPYPNVDVNWESPEIACGEILQWVSSKKPLFRIQPSSAAQKTIAKHLVDPSGEQWRNEQQKLMYGMEKDPRVCANSRSTP